MASLHDTDTPMDPMASENAGFEVSTTIFKCWFYREVSSPTSPDAAVTWSTHELPSGTFLAFCPTVHQNGCIGIGHASSLNKWILRHPLARGLWKITELQSSILLNKYIVGFGIRRLKGTDLTCFFQWHHATKTAHGVSIFSRFNLRPCLVHFFSQGPSGDHLNFKCCSVMQILHIFYIHILYIGPIYLPTKLFCFILWCWMLIVPTPQFWLLQNRAEVLDCDTAMLATEVIKHGAKFENREMPCHAKCKFNIGIWWLTCGLWDVLDVDRVLQQHIGDSATIIW